VALLLALRQMARMQQQHWLQQRLQHAASGEQAALVQVRPLGRTRKRADIRPGVTESDQLFLTSV
jgi:hypothetical protein